MPFCCFALTGFSCMYFIFFKFVVKLIGSIIHIPDCRWYNNSIIIKKKGLLPQLHALSCLLVFVFSLCPIKELQEMNDLEITTEIMKSAPAVAVTGAMFIGISVNDLAAIVTIIYVVLQICVLIRNQYKNRQLEKLEAEKNEEGRCDGD